MTVTTERKLRPLPSKAVLSGEIVDLNGVGSAQRAGACGRICRQMEAYYASHPGEWAALGESGANLG
ncbi:MAG: hypothetical protein IKK44_02650 [Clostridium sp.]|nr:hypothetical protein [Clostridium sp.]